MDTVEKIGEEFGEALFKAYNRYAALNVRLESIKITSPKPGSISVTTNLTHFDK